MNDAFYINNFRGFTEVGRKMPPVNIDKYPQAGQKGYYNLGDHLGASIVL